MKILVTGGMGYTAGPLVDELANNPRVEKVTILDNFLFKQYYLVSNQYRDVDIVNGDIRDYFQNQKFLSKFDVVIHLAALVGAPLCNRLDRQHMMQFGMTDYPSHIINNLCVKTLCRNLSPNQWLIYPNTNSGYGKSDAICTEETPLNPISSYGVTKAEGEKHVMERENSTALRLATVFGVSPRMRVDLLVNDFVKRLFYHNKLEIFEPNARRNYIHIIDLARVYIHTILRWGQFKGQIFNVGDDGLNMTKSELANCIKDIMTKYFDMNYAPEIAKKQHMFITEKEGSDPDCRDYVVSSQKLYNTGFKCCFTLDCAVHHLVNLFEVIPESATKDMSNV